MIRRSTTRIYAGDGRLLAEYAKENRVFVPIKVDPEARHQRLPRGRGQVLLHPCRHRHPGPHQRGLDQPARITGRTSAPVGASTITQQVTKNFLLTNERSIDRKIKEAILALRIEKAFSKDRILELYLNQIYLGEGNYGVAAAALNYFNKSLDELTIGGSRLSRRAAQGAQQLLDDASIREAASERRDWVDLAHAGRRSYHARRKPTEATRERRWNSARAATEERFEADYFAEEVRRELMQRFGEDGLYKKGLTVKATVDPHLQEIADRDPAQASGRL